MVIVINLDEVCQIEVVGLDVIVVQGIEVGGYCGIFDEYKDEEIGIFVLVCLLVMQCWLLVIVVGGIMDGVGIVVVLWLGVQVV